VAAEATVKEVMARRVKTVEEKWIYQKWKETFVIGYQIPPPCRTAFVLKKPA
jgi:hypothetical protein